METMFQDIELSKQLSKNFRLSLPDTHAIELSVNVICPASWPPYPQTTANYPPEVSIICEKYFINKLIALYFACQYHLKSDKTKDYTNVSHFTVA